MAVSGSLFELCISGGADDFLRFRIRNQAPTIRARSSKAPTMAPAMAPIGTEAGWELGELTTVIEGRDEVSKEIVEEAGGD